MRGCEQNVADDLNLALHQWSVHIHEQVLIFLLCKSLRVFRLEEEIDRKILVNVFKQALAGPDIGDFQLVQAFREPLS